MIGDKIIDEKELSEFNATILTGVTVAIGSLILLFASGVHVLIQCPFECSGQENIRHGHGEQVRDGSLLFDYLNGKVEGTEFDEKLVLMLKFEDEKIIKIIPERKGLESYVVTTRFGIYPVMAA